MKILFSHKKWSTDSCNNTDKPWKHYAKWQKPHSKFHLPHDFIYLRYAGKNSMKAQRRLVVARSGGERGMGNDCWWVSFWDDKNVLELYNADGYTTLWKY